MNLIKKIKKAFNHNMFLSIAAITVIGLALYMFGCQPTVQSPINEQKKVTRVQLDVEKEYVLAKFKNAYEDLAQQEIFRQKLFEIGMVAAQGGTINPIGAAVTLLGVLGIGAVADNRKKDSIIKTLKNGKTTDTNVS